MAKKTKEENAIANRKPKAKLIGANGNIFSILGIANAALRAAGQADKVDELNKKVTSSLSYDEALGHIMEYVEVV